MTEVALRRMGWAHLRAIATLCLGSLLVSGCDGPGLGLSGLSQSGAEQSRYSEPSEQSEQSRYSGQSGQSGQSEQSEQVNKTDKAYPEEQAVAPDDGVTYERISLPNSLVHVVRIPAQADVRITPAIAPDGLQKLEVLAQEHGAIAAINGGFFDPNNQQTTSYVTIGGERVLDPEANQGLMENPNVAIYLEQILNRSEFRRYQCSTATGFQNKYAIEPHVQLTPVNCTLIDALGAGPALLPNFRGEVEAFLDPVTGRDALGSAGPNARSAIGITPEGTVVLAIAAQRADVRDRSGLSLFELAEVMASLGVEQGLNLDGGSSSSLYFDGTTHYGRLDADKNVVERSVKSVLLVVPEL